MTADELADIVKGMAPVLKTYVAQQIAASVTAATTPLEARIKSLEAQPLPKYCGVYQAGADYLAGSLVTRSGGLWLATIDTHDTPGAGSAWRLIVKEGAAR
jgi:hypothetical protein